MTLESQPLPTRAPLHLPRNTVELAGVHTASEALAEARGILERLSGAVDHAPTTVSESCDVVGPRSPQPSLDEQLIALRLELAFEEALLLKNVRVAEHVRMQGEARAALQGDEGLARGWLDSEEAADRERVLVAFRRDAAAVDARDRRRHVVHRQQEAGRELLAHNALVESFDKRQLQDEQAWCVQSSKLREEERREAERLERQKMSESKRAVLPEDVPLNAPYMLSAFNRFLPYRRGT